MKLYPLDMLLAVGGSDNLIRRWMTEDHELWSQKTGNQIQNIRLTHQELIVNSISNWKSMKSRKQQS
ncbi:hypothetical protein DWV75_03795 [Ruminococcus sp. AF12-5]|nr:hypothetical protein DWV75_03795 [Ruminococcus sp. AF12-5]